MNIKPLIISSRGAGVFVDPDGRMEVLANKHQTQDRIQALLKELKTEMGDGTTVLDALFITSADDYQPLFNEADSIDVVLAYVLGVTPIEELLRWPGPIIAFSGQFRPAMALYAVGEERHQRSNLFVALDYQDILQTLRILEAKQSISRTRVVFFGSPPTWHLRWYGFQDGMVFRIWKLCGAKPDWSSYLWNCVN